VPESNRVQDVLQAIINKICNVTPGCPDCPTDSTTTTVGGTIVDFTGINLCLPDTWSTSSSNCCITPIEAGVELTNTEVVQALTSRIVSLSTLAKEQAALIEALTSRLDTLEATVNDCDCCRVSDVEAQVAAITGQIVSINSQITTINSNCC
jgi:hypothetical protein